MNDKYIPTRKEVREWIEECETAEFIKAARGVHGNKYDYSQTWITIPDAVIDQFILDKNIKVRDA